MIRRRSGYFVVAGFLVIGLAGGSGMFAGHGIGDIVFGATILALSWLYAFVQWRNFHLSLWLGRLLVGTSIRWYWLKPSDVASVSLTRDRDQFGRAGNAPVIMLRSGKRLKLGAFFSPDSAVLRNTYAQDVVNEVGKVIGPLA